MTPKNIHIWILTHIIFSWDTPVRTGWWWWQWHIWSWLTTVSLFNKASPVGDGSKRRISMWRSSFFSTEKITSIMPRTLSHLPLSSADDHLNHHRRDNLYSKSEKTKKSLQHLSQNRTSLLVFLASLLGFLIGIAGIIFSVVAFLREKPVPIFRCGRSEDTFRDFYSLPSSRRLGGRDASAGTGTVIDRPKFLGFVGIQTGFSSIDRRNSLRSTWFPSDPESLLRYIIYHSSSSV